MITLGNVSKRYGKTWAARNLSFTVEEGELCCLIGPSGCGKSTTLKMINRMIEPSSGTITVAGTDVQDVPAERLRRSMGYVIQSIGLFPHMTVLDNIRVVPRLLHWDDTRSKKRARELLELLELAPDTFGGKYPVELSGGQAQRVGVARALAADPQILLMDEPFGALDPISRENLQNQFLAIQKELHKTIVFVTHDIDEAVRLGSKVALLKEGSLVQYAAPEQLLSSPANAFVKKFVGLDRALKRLSRLLAVDFLHPANSVERRVAPELLEAEFRRLEGSDCARYLWVTDEHKRLVGWLDGNIKTGSKVNMFEDLVEIDLADMSVRPDSSLKQALAMFVQQSVVCLPVVDDERRLQGEIRLADVLES
ncbi:MAG: glycine/betaine ABC transporter ATPase [Desulfobulbaceae bacterium BRH_c16a]|nr:MAG: glycine/betaine ABC transporter ATPase [Desulfobulbaceae bacterium BRH_c16a]